MMCRSECELCGGRGLRGSGTRNERPMNVLGHKTHSIYSLQLEARKSTSRSAVPISRPDSRNSAREDLRRDERADAWLLLLVVSTGKCNLSSLSIIKNHDVDTLLALHVRCIVLDGSDDFCDGFCLSLRLDLQRRPRLGLRASCLAYPAQGFRFITTTGSLAADLDLRARPAGVLALVGSCRISSRLDIKGDRRA